MRDAAIECLEEIYPVTGEQLLDMISEHTLRPAMQREVYARLHIPLDVPLGSSEQAAGAPEQDTACSSGAQEWQDAPQNSKQQSSWQGEDSSASTAFGAAKAGRRRGGFNVSRCWEAVLVVRMPRMLRAASEHLLLAMHDGCTI